MDQWSGYDAGRTRLLEFFARRRASQPGRAHRRHPQQLGQRPEGRLPATRSRRSIATEFVGTSITSGGDGVELPERLNGVMAENPFVKFHNAQRGYVSCSVTPQRWQTDYQVVDFVTKKDAPRRTRASFVVADGRPGAERL